MYVDYRQSKVRINQNLWGTGLKRNYMRSYLNKKGLNAAVLNNRLTDGGKVIILARRQQFTPRKIPATYFC
jgi:hypothetical protein